MPSEDVVIVDAVRTPIGRRNGGLVQRPPGRAARHRPDGRSSSARASTRATSVRSSAAASARSASRASTSPAPHGSPPGCRCPRRRRRSTPSAAPASRRRTWPPSLVGAGVVDVALACGVEVMSRIPIGINSSKKLGLGIPIPKTYFGRYEMTSQFEGAERIAEKWAITREDTDRFGLASQQRAATAWAEGRYDGQWVAVEAPDVDEEGEPTGSTHIVDRDEGLRETSLEKLATLKPVAREDGVHTAGNSSQISDGAAAVLLATAGAGRGARAAGPGPHRRHVPRRRRPGADADRTDRRHPAPARAHRPVDRRHRRVRDQRGVRLGRAGLGQGDGRRPRRRPTRTAAPSPSATRSAPPARS